MITASVTDADTTRALRLAVLRNGDPTYSTAPGDSPDAIHLGATEDGRLVGAGVLLPEPCPRWPGEPALRLRGMAVASEDQGRGIGSVVLAAAVDIAHEKGLRTVWCNARSTARGFYERHGFHVEGDEFVIPDTGVPHFLMWRNLSGDPPRHTP